jgi:hypothetical protein
MIEGPVGGRSGIRLSGVSRRGIQMQDIEKARMSLVLEAPPAMAYGSAHSVARRHR